MRTDFVIAAREAVPFARFELFLADGRSLIADGADCLSVSEEAETALLFLPDEDASEILDLRLVVSFRFLKRGQANAGSTRP